MYTKLCCAFFSPELYSVASTVNIRNGFLLVWVEIMDLTGALHAQQMSWKLRFVILESISPAGPAPGRRRQSQWNGWVRPSLATWSPYVVSVDSGMEPSPSGRGSVISHSVATAPARRQPTALLDKTVIVIFCFFYIFTQRMFSAADRHARLFQLYFTLENWYWTTSKAVTNNRKVHMWI